ncbi:hypothetical protein BaRGS_00015712 [Batillaria attramentaria]|uniref:Uncharacterized protein n=1 Tax=Batillaria attramentaria TaxID=370345 RepID=A0ABD0L0Q0_9CAEN
MKSGLALLSALLLISAGRTLTQFAGTTEQVTMPCKFNAVYQQCGDYLVTVTPGQRYLPPWYIISSLHVSVKDAATSALLWEGRTDYKVGAKYLYEFKKVDENGKTVLRQPAPFAKIDGSKETEELFSFSKTRKEVKIAEKKGAFHVSFGPYDPEEGFKSSSWEFACFGPGKMQLTQYPTQICGDGIAARRDELGFKDKIQAFFYDVFTNRDIAQTYE